MNNFDFLTALAKGKNPFTGEKCKDNEVLRNPDVVAKLYEIAMALPTPKRKPLSGCAYTTVMGERIKTIAPHASITPFAKNIAKEVPLSYTKITTIVQDYLIKIGELEIRPDPDDNNKEKKFATEKGEQVGIINATPVSANGTSYHIIHYTVEGQLHVISLLSEIIKSAQAEK